MLCTEKVTDKYGDGRESGEHTEVRHVEGKRKCGSWCGEDRILKFRNI